MTETEWLASADPGIMLQFLTAAASDRKLRLFACACCRLIWDDIPEGSGRWAVQVSERFADGLATQTELQQSWAAASRAARSAEARFSVWNRLTAAEAEARDAARAGAWSAAHTVVVDAPDDEAGPYSGLLRDIFNPFHPLQREEAWQTPAVLSLAQSIYAERDFGRLPELATALEAVGCADAVLLGHLRGPGPHVRGCWALDLLVGLS